MLATHCLSCTLLVFVMHFKLSLQDFQDDTQAKGSQQKLARLDPMLRIMMPLPANLLHQKRRTRGSSHGSQGFLFVFRTSGRREPCTLSPLQTRCVTMSRCTSFRTAACILRSSATVRSTLLCPSQQLDRRTSPHRTSSWFCRLQTGASLTC